MTLLRGKLLLPVMKQLIWLIVNSFLMDVSILEIMVYPGRNAAFGPINLFSRSLYSGHKLLINNKPVSTIFAPSNYGAIIDCLLNYGPESNEQLIDVGWEG